MKKLFLLGLFALLNILSARAYDFKVDGIYYNIISDTSVEVTFATETRYDGESYDYIGSKVIPAKVMYDNVVYIVKGIGWSAFQRCKMLTSVVIPEGVTYIGMYAFYDCTRLTSVEFPESVTSIGRDAFYRTSINRPLYNSKVFAYIPRGYSGEYTIPSGIQSIAPSAFSDCTRLTSVTIPEGVTSIGQNAFSDCTRLTSVTIPEGVTSIEYGLFDFCSGLTSVEIPESVTSIGQIAFRNCSGLTSVTIPKSVTIIYAGAFWHCSSLKSVEWNAANCDMTGGNASVFDSISSITFGPEVESIPAYLCQGGTSLTSVTLSESVKSVGYRAFQGTSIGSPLYNSKVFVFMPADYEGEYTIPSGIQSIATTAFHECTGLTSVTIPEGVVEIGYWGFNGCSGLKSITLPASLDTIGYNAFGGCGNCDSVTSWAKKPPYCESYWSFGSDYVILYVPYGSKAAYASAKSWKEFSKIKEIATVTVQANDESMGRVTGGGKCIIGERVRLEAFPNDGYHFVRWDDGSTANPYNRTVTEDVTFTAIFAKDSDIPPTANEETLSAASFAYVQGRTVYLSDGLGEVEAFTATGQRVYRGTNRTITLPRPGVYILRVVADGRRSKVIVR